MWRVARLYSRNQSLIGRTQLRKSTTQAINVIAKKPALSKSAPMPAPPPPSMAMAPSWSSPNDQVPRNIFSSDYSNAWSLLEACLESGQMERAESVLLGLAEIASEPTDVTLAVNNYLLRLVHQNIGKPHVAENWLRRISYVLKSFMPNKITEAIMLKNAHLSGDKGLLRAHVNSRLENIPHILSHIEVLGIQTTRDILDVCQAELANIKVDTRTKALLEPSRDKELMSPSTEIEAIGSSPKGTAPLAAPIKKEGYETLEPTQSVGLKGIRHVLSGMELDESALQFQPLVQDKSVEKSNFTNFFEMSKHVKPEDRAAFDEYLENINEKRQRSIETRGIEAARMKWQEMFDRMVTQDRNGDEKVQLKGLEMLLWQWNQDLLPLIKEEYERVQEVLNYKTAAEVPKTVKDKMGKSFADRFEYGPYLMMAKLENLPAMTMMELLRLNSARGVSDGVRSVQAVLAVGKNVELDCRLRAFKQKEREALNGLTGRHRARAVASIKRRIRKLSMDSTQSSWPNHVRAKIGSMLISLFLQVAKITVYGKDPVTGRQVKGRAPAFYHAYQYQGGNKIGMLRAHKEVARHLTGEHTAAVIAPQQLPMLVKPRPWTAWNDGGYHYSESRIIRTRESPEQVAYMAAASQRGQLQKVYDGLNVLGNTAWTINQDMFRIISKIWNSKKEFLDIPEHVPPQLDASMIPAAPARDADPQVRRDYMRELRALTLANSAKYSQRCDLNYKLDIARAFLGERFYMPHNLDFRGRAYPLSPHLNHLGNDVSRSLLMFWEGKKLGPNGFKWLKVHLANLFGNSKMSHDERVQFVEDNMDKVLDSAANPLEGQGWWKGADSPFQALATCIEISNARKLADPAEYVSHLTVHQDGSCNGLQHYAALGGDYEGACEVNLAVADRPQDVYSRVLEIVKEKVAADAESGNELAKQLHPVLTRKVVKQTVMTHVYGVTYIGAREQIANRLREIEGFPAESVYNGSSYMANKVLGAVRQLFESAHLIQDWLGENASRISHSVVLDATAEEVPSVRGKQRPDFMSSVIWTTPLGLPIVQPYRQEKRRQVATELQTVYITDPFSCQGVNARKQRTAFAPNFIHSLDATHMLMSAIACAEHNISFAAVHDSYWTHASDVDTLNKNLRECFVDLHSEDLITQLRDEFTQRYGSLLQYVQIPASSAVAQQILKARSDYARTKFGTSRALTIREQIEMERERRAAVAKGEPVLFESPVSIISELPTEQLEQLIAEAGAAKKSSKKSAVPRSTEFEGTGLDAFEATDSDDAIAEDEAVSTKGGRVVNVMVPLRVPEVPSKGEFDVRRVLESPYFFS